MGGVEGAVVGEGRGGGERPERRWQRGEGRGVAMEREGNGERRATRETKSSSGGGERTWA